MKRRFHMRHPNPKIVLSGLLALVLAVSPVGAGNAKAHQLVLSGNFSSAQLSTAQKIQIERFIKSNLSSGTLVCTGVFQSKRAGKNLVNSRSMAEQTCDFAFQFNRTLTLVTDAKAPKPGLRTNQIILSFASHSFVPSSYLNCDTSAVDTNLPSISQKNVMTVTCFEDRQAPAKALLGSNQLSKPEVCEIPDQSRERRDFDTLMVGFPRHTNNIKAIGSPKISVIPVDWEDQPGEGKPSTIFRKEIQKFRDYYRMVSYGKLDLEIQFNDEWFRLPGKMLDYKVTESDYRSPYSDFTKAQKTRLFQNGVSAADPKVDFSKTEMVVFLLPPKQKAIDVTLQAFFNGDLPEPAKSQEGLVKNFMAAGNEFPVRMFWSYWAHEFGHAIMLPDWYVNSANFGNYEDIQIPIGPFSGYDLMSTNGGPSMSVSLWSRWMMGWSDSNHIFCSDYSSLRESSFRLEPIDSNRNSLKGVIIRTSDSKAVIVESRRKTSFDEPTLRSRNGVLVYTIDTKLGHGEGAKALVAPKGRGLYYPYVGKAGAPQLDAILYLGNSVEIEGLRITVNAVGEADVISISKIIEN